MFDNLDGGMNITGKVMCEDARDTRLGQTQMVITFDGWLVIIKGDFIMPKHIIEQVMDKLTEVNNGPDVSEDWAKGYIEAYVEQGLLDSLEQEQLLEWVQELIGMED